ncbi:MAG TPA: HD domain-containing protein [Pseudomonadales bacterium]
MVKVRQDVARAEDGRLDVDAWVAELAAEHGNLDPKRLREACELVRGLGPRGEEFLESGMEMAELVGELRLDTASVVAALAYRPVRVGLLGIADARAAFGDDAAHLLEEVLRMATTSLLELNNTRLQTSERRDQADNVRRMLIAMIDDARVAVLKLAERVVALRAAKHYDAERQQKIAREAHLVFAPLANRLGIWQLKWELEDLALRYLAPDIYRAIAKQLDGRREERERQVQSIARELEALLREQGIEATVHGRAKHIYSIWRKMRSKNVPFGQVYDVRAVRVVVPDIASCYAALGVIHTRWRHVPSEFDDYIASPKENGYRSIHTAVIAPDGRSLEVQIRTQEMHEQAELGVCAHWSYKEGNSEDRPYAEKMNWLRQVVEWRDDVERSAARDLGEELRALFRDERIFVTTPKGHVLDLARGATPVDFAYRVHTEIGHRCRGALVDGVPRALNVPLATGERVEIITGDEAAPERDWLDIHLGYVKTGRARQKILDWFRARDPADNEREGRLRILKLLERVGQGDPPASRWEEAARALDYPDAPALWRAVGCGDCQVLDALEALFPAASLQRQLELLPDVDAGGRRLRVLDIRAADREGLLRDVTQIVSALELPLVGSTGRADPISGQARIQLEILASSLSELATLVDRLIRLEGVIDARVDPR